MPERIDPIVIDLTYKYDKSNLDKAKTDISSFTTTSTTGVGKAKNSLKSLKEIYNSLQQTIDKDNEKIKKSLNSVNNALSSAEKAQLDYKKKMQATKAAKANLDSINSEFAAKGYFTSKFDKGAIYSRTKGSGLIEKNESATRKLASATNAYKTAQLSQKQSTISFNTAINNLATSESELVSIQQKLNSEQAKSISVNNTAKNNLDGLNNKLAGIAKTLKGIRLVNLYALFYICKRATNYIQSFIKASSDWIENLNLLEVTFSKTTESAKEFIDVTANNFGLDKNALAQYVSVFKQMANAMGQVNEVGTQMSKVLTLVALDVSSLRNIGINTVISDFTSALAGQVKPVRKYGFDITMYSIDELMKEAGFGSYSRTMTQAQKQLARTILLIRQSRDAWGDLSKTINTFANQQRIMQDQLATSKRLLGNLFLGTIQVGDSFEEATLTAGFATKAIWYLNGALLALNEVMKLYAPETTNFSTGIATGAEEATEALEEMEEATSESLAKFDKFNTLGSGGSKTNVNTSINDTLSSLLSTEYDSYMAKYTERMEQIDMYAKQISNSLLSIVYSDFGKWLENSANSGKSFSDWLKETGATVDQLKTKNNNLKDGFLGIVALIATIKSPILALIGVITKLFVENEKVRNTLTEIYKTICELFSTAGVTFVKILEILAPILKVLLGISNAILQIVNATDLASVALIGVLTAIVAIKALKSVDFIKSALVSLKSLVGWLKATNITLYSSKTSAVVASNGMLQYSNAVSLASVATSALLGFASFLVIDGILSNIGEDARKIVSPILLAASAVIGLATAFLALKGVISWGVGLAVIVPAIGVAVASLKNILKPDKANAYANGGFQSGGLFYAGESGAEWVGRQGNTSTIVNDSQMSDIMEEAVAKGVVLGNSYSKQNTNTTSQPVIVNLDGRRLFEVVEDNGKRVGKVFARA